MSNINTKTRSLQLRIHRIVTRVIEHFGGFTVNYKLLFLKQTWCWWKAWFWSKASILLIIQSTTGLNSSILGWLGEHRWFSGGKGAMLPPQQVLLTPKFLWRIAKGFTSKWTWLDLAPWWHVGWWYERRNIIQGILVCKYQFWLSYFKGKAWSILCVLCVVIDTIYLKMESLTLDQSHCAGGG